MCGIVGMAGELTAIDEKIMSTLLVLDSLRGTDSTGVAVVSRQGETKIAKAVGDPFQLFDNKKYDKALQGINSVIIGHNRYATQGKVNTTNAHPFDFPNLVGVHNGTLTSKYRLKDAASFTVDSENLYHHINEEGLHSALEHLNGAWALAWWDKREKAIKFLRNKDRPLFVTRREDGKAIYWASESWMLSVALSRSNIKHGEIIQFEEDVLHSFTIGPAGELGKVHVSQAPSRYVAPVFTQYTGGFQSSPKTGSGTETRIDSPKESKETKSTGRPTLCLAKPNTTYGGSKGLTLWLISQETDSHGGCYYKCMDEENINETIRYYYQKGKNDDLLGCSIVCDIGYMNFDNQGSYFKVINTSVSLIVDENIYKNHKGKGITYNEWVSLYGTCEWCSTPVAPTDVFRLTTEGQCLCATCAPIAQEYVQFI